MLYYYDKGLEFRLSAYLKSPILKNTRKEKQQWTMNVLKICEAHLNYLDSLKKLNCQVLSKNQMTFEKILIKKYINNILHSYRLYLSERKYIKFNNLAKNLPSTFRTSKKLKPTFDWWFPNDELWKNHLLNEFEPNKKYEFLELGSFQGISSIWLVNNLLKNPKSKLTCLDYFLEEASFDLNLKASSSYHKVEKIKGEIGSNLNRLKNNHYDLIYIDAARKYQDQIKHLNLSWKKLKRLGVMIVDDCGGPDWWEPEVRTATEDFFRQKKSNVITLLKDFQWIIKKVR